MLGWGVGGIEAEAVLLGQPLYLLTPQVVGFRFKGRLPEGTTATDLVLVVTQILRKRGVVGHQHKRHAALVVLGEQEVDDLLSRGLIEISSGFVRDQDCRIRRQGAGKGHALLLAARQLRGIMMQSVAKPDRHQFLRGAPRRIGVAGELQRHRDVLQRRHGGDQMKRLEYDADLAAAKARQRVLVEGIERGAVDHHLSAIRTLQPRHYHQQCGFPRARRADQADRFTRRHAQADIFEDMYARRARAQREIDVRNGNGVRLEAGQ